MKEERLFEEGSDGDEEFYKDSAYIMSQKLKKRQMYDAKLAK